MLHSDGGTEGKHVITRHCPGWKSPRGAGNTIYEVKIFLKVDSNNILHYLYPDREEEFLSKLPLHWAIG